MCTLVCEQPVSWKVPASSARCAECAERLCSRVESQGPEGPEDGERAPAGGDPGESHSLQSKCLESSTFLVTSKVTVS